MLDKASKRLLKSSINKIHNNEHKEYTQYDEILITPNELKMTYIQANSVCKHLKKLGYIKSYYHVSRNDENLLIHITYEGEHYFELNWLEIKQFLFRSVFVPVGVSIATSLFTLFVTYLITG